MIVLVTGAAGFIGMHLCKKLIENETQVIGVDNFSNYYDPELKKSRINLLTPYKLFNFYQLDVANQPNLIKSEIFKHHKISHIVHLAAQPGIQFNSKYPQSGFDNNLKGFFNILELARLQNCKHFLYASSSSVYGDKKDFNPCSFYGATKRANELLAYSYSKLYHLPTTGLRLFSVYGPWGRPDMAPIKFINSILQGDKIQLRGNGEMERDFTYIDDVTHSILLLLNKNKHARFLDIGSENPIKIISFLNTLEKVVHKKAHCVMEEKNPDEVWKTRADLNELKRLIKFTPQVSLTQGLEKLFQWYLSYYQKD